MNTMGMGVLIIGAATYLSVACALAFRKRAEKIELGQYTSMADPMLNVVATLFSILLGFLVAGAMDDYAETRSQVEMEANKLADVYILARGLPDPYCQRLQDACRDYCNQIINLEWPAMAQRKTSPVVWGTAMKIWDACLSFRPTGEREVNIHETLLGAVQELGEGRRHRVVAMREKLSPALWIVVIGGSIILMACTYMFFIKDPRLQGLMVGMVALSLSLNVSLLAIYSSPFIGDLRIKPEAFELDAKVFSRPVPPLELEPAKSAEHGDD